MKDLLRKYLEDDCTKDELIQLMREISDRKKETDFEAFMQEQWSGTEARKVGEVVIDFDSILDKIHHDISIKESLVIASKKKRSVRGLYQWSIRAAAALMLPILGIAIWLLVSQGEVEQTLSQQVFVSEVPAGQFSKLILPDSTVVWLNSRSRLSYDAAYGKTNRCLELSGEGYFSVAKDKKRPFVVRSKGQEIVALGTRFNVSAYQNEPTVAVILEEGSVRIDNVAGSTFLKPNQMAVISADNRVNVNTVEASKYIAWHSGKVRFDDERLVDIARQLEKQFDITITFQDEEIKNYRFRGSYNLTDSLTEILDVLRFATGIKYTLKDNEIELRR
jgi:ferric-dicitrate binding protein FerR (iron transport regulator)